MSIKSLTARRLTGARAPSSVKDVENTRPVRSKRGEATVAKFRKALGPFVVAAEATRMPMIFTDAATADNTIIFANESMLRLTGFRREELLGQRFDFLASRDGDRQGRIACQFNSHTHDDLETTFRRKVGPDFWAAMFVTPVSDLKGKVVQHFLSLIDLTKYKESESALRLSEGRFRLAATAAGLGVADINLVTHQEHWSGELRAILGVGNAAPASVETYSALVHPEERKAVGQMHKRYLAGKENSRGQGTYRIVRPVDGVTRWIASQSYVVRDDDGAVVRMVVTNRDITDEKGAQDRVTWAATHDGVTGLPNRTLFRAELEAELAAGTRTKTDVSLLLLDLDHFKHINDQLGHQAGDEALASFAARVSDVLPDDTMLARLGGDEFAAILPDTSIAEAAAVAKEVLAGLEDPFSIGDRNVDLRASIGASVFPKDGRQSSALIHSADLALFAGKKAGGSRVKIFASELRRERQRQLSMLRHAQSVLDNDWIEPFYQPKIELATGRTAGFEALLRWRHPRAGVQLPKTIEYAFDDSHMASRIGAAMTDAVLSDLCRWIGQKLPIGKIAMNASAAELRDASYADRFLEALAGRNVPANKIELEITETALLDYRGSTVIATLEALRLAGTTVALDDFGTGFSSLSHLRHFPVDTIKIDRSFVAGLDQSERDRSIIEAVLLLGQALGLTTVAEGVETQGQFDFLKAHGCTLAQGFFFAPALEVDTISGWLKKDWVAS